jgi:hypothetical protein
LPRLEMMTWEARLIAQRLATLVTLASKGIPHMISATRAALARALMLVATAIASHAKVYHIYTNKTIIQMCNAITNCINQTQRGLKSMYFLTIALDFVLWMALPQTLLLPPPAILP